MELVRVRVGVYEHLTIYQPESDPLRSGDRPLGPRIERVTSPELARLKAEAPEATAASPSLDSVSIDSSIEAVGEVIERPRARKVQGDPVAFPVPDQAAAE